VYIYIYIEDLVANALIEQMKKNNEKSVLFEKLDDYGARVVDYINNKTNNRAVLLVSQQSTMDMLVDYSDYFELYEDENGKQGIKLKNGITADNLWEQFRSYLSYPMIKAFMDKECVEALGA
jgi:hypothetical protein